MQVLLPSLPPLSLFLWFAGFDWFPRIPRSQWRERRQGEMDSSNLLCVKCTLHYNKHMKKADWFLLWKDLYDDFVQNMDTNQYVTTKDAHASIHFQKVCKSAWIHEVKGHFFFSFTFTFTCILTISVHVYLYLCIYLHT